MINFNTRTLKSMNEFRTLGIFGSKMSPKYFADKQRAPNSANFIVCRQVLVRGQTNCRHSGATTAHNPCANHSHSPLSCKDLLYSNLHLNYCFPVALQLDFASTNVCKCCCKWGAVWKRGSFHLSHISLCWGRDKMGWGTKFEWDHQREKGLSVKRLKRTLCDDFLFSRHTYHPAGHWLIYGPVLMDTCFWRQIHCPAVIGSFLSDVPCWGTKQARRDTRWWLRKSSRAFSTLLTDPGPGMIFARRGIGGERALRMQNVTQN